MGTPEKKTKYIDMASKYKRTGKNRRDQHADLINNAKFKEKSKSKFRPDGLEMWRKSDDIEYSDRLEGRNPVYEALKSGRPLNKIIMAKGIHEGLVKKIWGMARDQNIIIQEVDREKLDAISDTGAHQGIIAYVASAKYVEVEDILNKAKGRGESPFILILDEITDPQNLGAIIRTADSAGVHGIIIPKRRAVGLTSVVAKASAGAIEYVPVARVSNIGQTIDLLKKNGIWVVGTDASGEQRHYKKDLTGPIAIVTGSEGEGISRLVKDKCDFIVKIPMKGKVSSLNASVSAALVMYEIVRQRENAISMEE